MSPATQAYNSSINVLIMYTATTCFDVLSLISAGKTSGGSKSSAWAAVWVILIGLAMASGGAYLVYKYRLRVSFFCLIFVFKLRGHL